MPEGRHTFRLTPEAIEILDRVKEAGFYGNRNAALQAVILGFGRQFADKLEQSFGNCCQVDSTPTAERQQLDSRLTANHWEDLINDA